MIKSDIIFLNLFKLNFNLKETTKIKSNDLERAFYTYQKLIEEKFNIILKYDYDIELVKFFCLYPDIILDDFDIIYIKEDNIAELEKRIMSKRDLAEENFIIEDFITPQVIGDLNISITDNEGLMNLFTISGAINEIYSSISILSSKGNNYQGFISLLNGLIKTLKNEVLELDDKSFNILYTLLKCLNNEVVKNEWLDELDYLDTSWYMALFNSTEEDYFSIAKLESYVFTLAEYKNEFNEEISDELDCDELSTDCELDNDTFTYFNNEEESYFLTSYYINLKNYIDNLRLSSLKLSLTKRLYKLLLTPYLNEAENNILENGEEQIVLPEPDFDLEDVNNFYTFTPTAYESILTLDFTDLELKDNPEYLESMILHAIFLKTFLSLSCDNTTKDALINQITTSGYYKSTDYQVISSLIDEIIFDNDFHRNL